MPSFIKSISKYLFVVVIITALGFGVAYVFASHAGYFG